MLRAEEEEDESKQLARNAGVPGKGKMEFVLVNDICKLQLLLNWVKRQLSKYDDDYFIE